MNFKDIIINKFVKKRQKSKAIELEYIKKLGSTLKQEDLKEISGVYEMGNIKSLDVKFSLHHLSELLINDFLNIQELASVINPSIVSLNQAIGTYFC